jgi:phage gpG-like protein
MTESKFNFARIQANLEKVKEEAPTVLSNHAKNYFASSFVKGGFDQGEKPWKEVKRRIPGEKAYKYPKSKGLGRRTRAILVKSGRLRRAVQNSIRSARWNRVQLLVDVPYAKFHNVGDRKAHLPRRQFMGKSRKLNAQLLTKFKKLVNRIWKA